MYQNLREAWRQWGIILRVLAKTGATVRAQGMMYKGVTHSVLLYCSDIWVATGGILKALEGFRHRAERQIVGMTATSGVVGECQYPPVVVEMESEGLHPIRQYSSIK